MKEEWKVFIRGVEGRGDEVIDALKAVGGKINSNDMVSGDDNQWLYVINHGGLIDSWPVVSEIGKIIMDNYKEIELPEKWKDGDILVDNDDPNRFVVKNNVWNDGNFKAYLYVALKYIQESPIATFRDKNYHKADSKEVRRFHKILHNHGKDWDAERKQLTNWKWKPKENDIYYIIDNDGEITCDTWDGYHVDTNRYNFGNYFRTKEEAEAMAEKVKNLLKEE